MEGDAHVSDIVLRLYIAGKSAISLRAQQNIVSLQRSIKRGCKTEIIDVLVRPDLAEQAGVLATPTLSFERGGHSRRIVGDLHDTKRVVQFLGIELEEKDA